MNMVDDGVDFLTSFKLELTANHKGQFEFQLCVLAEGENHSEGCFNRKPEQSNNAGPIYEVPDDQNRNYAMSTASTRCSSRFALLLQTVRVRMANGNCNNGFC